MKIGSAKVRRVTARDVADALGLSTMTVSRALNGQPHVDKETRARVFTAAHRLGYSPNAIAKSLAQNRTFTIGVVVPEISYSFFPEAIRGIEEVAGPAGYHLILSHSAELADREREALEMLGSKRVDGILISTAQDVDDTRIYEDLLNVGVPLVFFDRCIRGIGATCVSIDDEQSSFVATEHLIRHGYRRIGHLAGPQKTSVGRERLDGYRRAMMSYGIAFVEELVVESGFHEAGGGAAMEAMLCLPAGRRPDAVVAVNDPAAFGAMKAIAGHGLSIPADIAIVGFSDDIRAPLMSVPLTTMRQPAYALGEMAAAKLLAAIADKHLQPEELIVKSELIIRASCGCSANRTTVVSGDAQ
jgi:DNA-binding LacI/PurR family transcriptional regulator